MEAISQKGGWGGSRGRESSVFHFGFRDSRFWSCSVQVRAHVTVAESLSLMAWESVCPLLEGKSILVLSLPVRLLPGEQKHKIHWQALLIQPSAIETYTIFQRRKARTLHISSLFEDKKWEVYPEIWRYKAFYYQITHKEKKPSRQYSFDLWCRTMMPFLMTRLTTLLQKSYTVSDSVGAAALFLTSGQKSGETPD